MCYVLSKASLKFYRTWEMTFFVEKMIKTRGKVERNIVNIKNQTFNYNLTYGIAFYEMSLLSGQLNRVYLKVINSADAFIKTSMCIRWYKARLVFSEVKIKVGVKFTSSPFDLFAHFCYFLSVFNAKFIRQLDLGLSCFRLWPFCFYFSGWKF